MISNRTLFLRHLAQTSIAPMNLEIERATGVFVFDKEGKKYFDLISGIAVSNVGHCHPNVIEAIEHQLKKYLHLMVYGEYIQAPQTLLAKKITSLLPLSLGSLYFVNSGSEAIEGAMKLAKRFSGRTEIISFKNSYHGSTQGALSIGGNESLKDAFRPLLPDVRILEFNNEKELDFISEKTACVVAETIQGEAGVILPKSKSKSQKSKGEERNFLQLLRIRCNETGALLVLDEIQTGFGRTGKMFAFEHYGIEPDILCLGKAMGGGMPLGAFVSSRKLMSSLAENPALGHITTFGGHPVSCASALAGLEVMENEKLCEGVEKKAEIFKKLLRHKAIKNFRNKGLLIALEFETEELNKNIISDCIAHGVITDWFLFAGNCMRIAPPLIITEKEISDSCKVIMNSITKFS